MKLTNQQITTIEETLVLNGVVYDDIKLELVDHIATENEVLMEGNSLSFEENVQMIFKRWDTIKTFEFISYRNFNNDFR
jgi:hypothetical protein